MRLSGEQRDAIKKRRDAIGPNRNEDPGMVAIFASLSDVPLLLEALEEAEREVERLRALIDDRKPAT